MGGSSSNLSDVSSVQTAIFYNKDQSNILLLGEYHDDSDNDYKHYIDNISSKFDLIIVENYFYGNNTYEEDISKRKFTKDFVKKWSGNKKQEIAGLDYLRASGFIPEIYTEGFHFQYISTILGSNDRKPLVDRYIKYLNIETKIYDYIKTGNNYNDVVEDIKDFHMNLKSAMNLDAKIMSPENNNIAALNNLKSAYDNVIKLGFASKIIADHYDRYRLSYNNTIEQYRNLLNTAIDSEESLNNLMHGILSIQYINRMNYMFYDIPTINKIIKNPSKNILVLCGFFHVSALDSFISHLGFKETFKKNRLPDQPYDFNDIVNTVSILNDVAIGKSRITGGQTIQQEEYGCLVAVLILLMLVTIFILDNMERCGTVLDFHKCKKVTTPYLNTLT